MPFADIIKKYFLHPISVVVVALAGAWACIAALPAQGDSYDKFWSLIILCSIVIVLYIIWVYCANKMPVAKGRPGVLFVFHAQTESLFSEVEFNLREDFAKISEEFKIKLSPVCISANRIKGYSSGNAMLITNLLRKTNCAICVDVVYQTNDAEKREYYEMKINVHAVHPDFSEEKNRFMDGEIKRMAEPVKSLKFKGDRKLEALQFAATHLNLATKYITALALILANDFAVSNVLLEELLASGKEFCFFESVKKAYYTSCLGLELANLDQFHQTGDMSRIDEAEQCLEKMNAIFPNTYGYNLDMAMIKFIKYSDVAAAHKHLAVCKKIKGDNHWKYSDAFLRAYSNEDACLVIKKYEDALETTYNVIDIITFTERVLETDPNRPLLHLALAILYHSLKDVKMTTTHLKSFLAVRPVLPGEKRLIRKIEQLQSNECKACTSDDCEVCKLSA